MLTTKMIGTKIGEARKKNNLSQAQLAEHLFISAQAVGKWERGESLPDLVTLSKLAEILSVDLNYFTSEATPFLSEKRFGEGTENTVDNLNSEPNEKKLKWNMSRGNWVDADFSGLKNLTEKFSSSNMERCLFIGSDLSGLVLSGNNVRECDFSNSDFTQSELKGSNLSNNKFKHCSLNETKFLKSYIEGCEFSDANFTETEFKSGGLVKNIISNATWNNTSFIEMYIQEMVFEGTLKDCSFENCAFSKVTFQNLTLINTFFKNKSLKRIKFIDCQADRMTYEFLKNGKADMSGIRLID